MERKRSLNIMRKTEIKGHPDKKQVGNTSSEKSIYRREIVVTLASIAITFLAWILFMLELLSIFSELFQSRDKIGIVQLIIFMFFINLLIYGNLLYQFTRLGYLKRRERHRPSDRKEMEFLYEAFAPALTILIPSYKEDVTVVKRTLLSAALQEYPGRRVVLLIDDPPNPNSEEDRVALEKMRELTGKVQALFAKADKGFQDQYREYLERRSKCQIVPEREVLNLSRLYEKAAKWLYHQATHYPVADHGDRLLVNKIFRELAENHRQRASDLKQSALFGGIEEAQIFREYRRLAALFHVELTSFERKRYVNLSHEPNKAMNLNSYISLLGKSFKEVQYEEGLYLEAMDPHHAEVHIPNADFLITLDADSLLTGDYALRLIHFMMQPENALVAVAQTPYSTLPDAPGSLEKIAGATTDIQYIIHQGFTQHGATYWVGANALLRKKALEEIREVDKERGFEILRYIQDRTVIEDTESSVDLIDRGWQLYNYPERLAYSATPPDFGSLLIQRRRWANGGLIIIPKLLRYLLRGPCRRLKLAEGFFRFHYLASITAVNFGLLILLAFSFEKYIRSPWLPLTAIPYFFLYARDLELEGYHWSDMFRVYALNLLLIPVNIGGVLKSLHQAVTGQKIPFGRTPKILDRTIVPPLYVFAEFTLLFMLIIGGTVDGSKGLWAHAVFSLGNAAILAYAIVRFIGLKESMEDLLSGIKGRLAYQFQALSVLLARLL